MTTTPNGAVLDVGRTRREPTRKQRAALLATDTTCIGCHAPATRCETHHIRWWTNGGRTDLDNLVLLCWSCHTHVHHHGWTVTTTPNGTRTLIPPQPPPPRAPP